MSSVSVFRVGKGVRYAIFLRERAFLPGFRWLVEGGGVREWA